MTVSGNNLTYKQLIRNLRYVRLMRHLFATKNTVISEDMKRRGFPQRPLVRCLADVATLFSLLTRINVHSSQAPMKLSVLGPPMHTFVTDILFRFRIRTSRSSFRKTTGESSETAADIAPARREAGHQRNRMETERYGIPLVRSP